MMTDEGTRRTRSPVPVDAASSTPPRPATTEHIAALDGLRGLAVAVVLLFHAGHLTGGYLGVDLFFVLSGFLITRLLISEQRQRGTIGLAGFWTRRARRLMPALLALLVGVCLWAVLFAEPIDLFRI